MRYHQIDNELIPFTPEEEAEWDAMESAWAAGANDRAAAEVRTERNQKLAETDWTALSDVTMSDEMIAYRQALRDITTQDGFPNEVTWPTKP